VKLDAKLSQKNRAQLTQLYQTWWEAEMIE